MREERFVERTLMRLIALVLLLGSALAQLQLPSPARWLLASDNQIYALLQDGQVLSIEGNRTAAIARGFSPDAPLRSGPNPSLGRVFGSGSDGSLVVIGADASLSRSEPLEISKHAGLLILPFGVIATTAWGEVLRLEPWGNRWNITARAKLNALPDGQLAAVDLEGNNDPQVAVLVGPSERYPHGVLGNPQEATSLLIVERHGLQVLYRYDLAAPFVFEDLLIRTLDLNGDGKQEIALVRSGPAGGAALALIGLKQDRLQLLATGPDFGQANRWLNPLVSTNQLYALHTPHIGGVLHRYRWNNNRLEAIPLQQQVSNHAIGSRNLEASLVLPDGRLVVPTQDHRSLLLLRCTQTCSLQDRLGLRAQYSSNLVALGNTIFIADEAGFLYRWNLAP